MKNKLIFAVFILLTITGCQKENTDETIVQEKFSAPSIELAKQYVNTYVTKNDSDLAFRDASAGISSVTDWQNSKTKKYKVTEELDVDILYTPIYVDSPRTDIKAFIASIDQNGIIDSRKIYVLYRSNDLSNGLNAYILIFGLDGNMLLAYNYVNGQSVPLPESNSSGNSINRNSSECDGDISNMTDAEFENWWANCSGIGLDEVVVTAPLAPEGSSNGSTPEFNDWNNQWVTVNIDPDFGQSSSYNSGNAIPINISWHTPNFAFANAASIAKVIGAEYISLEANWLRQMEQSNPTLLNIIADFLNASRVRNQNSEYNFDNIQPEQFPISESAIDFIIGLIGHLDGGASQNIGDGLNVDDLFNLEECINNNDYNSFDECLDIQEETPCSGDPVPQPELVDLPTSGKEGSTFGCTRRGDTDCPPPKDKFHDGLDIKADLNSNTYAMYSGTVSSIRNSFAPGEYKRNSFGNFVLITIQVNGATYFLKYNHLNSISVVEGQTVNAKDIIGTNGNTGNAASKGVTPHIHLQVFDTSWNSINPAPFLKTQFDESFNPISNTNCN